MLWVVLLSAALAGDKVKPVDFHKQGSFELQTAAGEAPLGVSLATERLVTTCVDTNAPGCVALQLTLTNSGTDAVTVDPNRIASTWWKDGVQRPLYPVTQTWHGSARGFAEVVVPPGGTWTQALAPSNPHVPTMIDVTEAVALRQLFQPGYTFQIFVPMTVGGEERWYTGTWQSVMPAAK